MRIYFSKTHSIVTTKNKYIKTFKIFRKFLSDVIKPKTYRVLMKLVAYRMQFLNRKFSEFSQTLEKVRERVSSERVHKFQL
jgi:hypothetical protein